MLGLAVCGVAASQFLDVATNNFSRAFIVSSSLASVAILFGIWILVKVPERTSASSQSLRRVQALYLTQNCIILACGFDIVVRVAERDASTGSALQDIKAGFSHFAKLSVVAYLAISFTVVWLCAYDDVKVRLRACFGLQFPIVHPHASLSRILFACAVFLFRLSANGIARQS